MKHILTTILLATIIAFSSCIKKNNLPPQPKIEFLDFSVYDVDSATCTVSFQDGDGDIGALDGKEKNLFLTYYYKDEATGQFLLFDNPSTSNIDTLIFEHSIPNLTPEGQNKSLEGEIQAKFSSLFFFPGHKVIKYEIYLIDRAGNESNKVLTNEIIVPQ